MDELLELSNKIAAAMQQVRDEIGATEQQKIAFGYAEAAMRSTIVAALRQAQSTDVATPEVPGESER